MCYHNLKQIYRDNYATCAAKGCMANIWVCLEALLAVQAMTQEHASVPCKQSK